MYGICFSQVNAHVDKHLDRTGRLRSAFPTRQTLEKNGNTMRPYTLAYISCLYVLRKHVIATGYPVYVNPF